jgi:hypothetical protein
MLNIKRPYAHISKILIWVFITLQFSACNGQINKNEGAAENSQDRQAPVLKQNTVFPQIHTNLNGMVREFVRSHVSRHKRELLVWQQMEMGLSATMDKHLKNRDRRRASIYEGYRNCRR